MVTCGARKEWCRGVDAARRETPTAFTTWTQAFRVVDTSFGKGVTGTGMRSIGGICDRPVEKYSEAWRQCLITNTIWRSSLCVSSDAGTRGSGAEYSMRRRNFRPLPPALPVVYRLLRDGLTKWKMVPNLVCARQTQSYTMNHALSCHKRLFDTCQTNRGSNGRKPPCGPKERCVLAPLWIIS